MTSKKNGIYKRSFSCLRKFCYNNDYENCICLDHFWQQRSSETNIAYFKDRGQRSVKVREDKDKYGSSSQDSASESEK